MTAIPLKQEYSGTLKMFALYPSLKDVLDNGGTLFVDELNTRLHPLLVRNIILTFLSPEINTQNAQLVFTTHDIWQYSNELLRRDEFWMVNKNKEAEFKDEDCNKVCRCEALAKNYLTGNYGTYSGIKTDEDAYRKGCGWRIKAEESPVTVGPEKVETETSVWRLRLLISYVLWCC